MKRVLVVSPHFPPANYPDMHRVRQSLPYLRALGWDATVLAVEPGSVEGAKDDALLATVPADAHVVRVPAVDARLTRAVGLGSLGLRAFASLGRAGSRLLAEAARAGRPFSLVYFSTTVFPVVALGPRWRARHGVPYVVDMQDPWRPDHYLGLPRAQQPPKFWFSYRLDAALEPRALRPAAGFVSVSQGYLDTLAARYPESAAADAARTLVLPFGGPEADFEVLDGRPFENPFFTPGDGHTHAVYVGRGGHDMARAARAVFGALADGLREQPQRFERVRMHFVGTSYAPEGEGRQTLLPLAEAAGVADRVAEHPARVPYFQALGLLRAADLTLVPGSDDPAYTASKLYPYILARRPLVAVFNRASSVVGVLEATRAGTAATFDADTSDADLRADVRRVLGDALARLPFTPDTDWAAFEPYTAREMTRRQAEFFEQILAAEARHGAGRD